MPALRRLANRYQLCGILLRWTDRHVICIDRVPGIHDGLFQDVGHVTQDPTRAPWGLFTTNQPPLGSEHRWWKREVVRLRNHGWTTCQADTRRRLSAPLRDTTGLAIGALVLAGIPSEIDHRLMAIGKDLATTAAACTRR